METADNKDKGEGNMFVGMFYNKIVYAVSLIIVTVSVTTIFNFLGIEFEQYGVYLIFFIGLAILSQVLPAYKQSVFSTKKG